MGGGAVRPAGVSPIPCTNASTVISANASDRVMVKAAKDLGYVVRNAMSLPEPPIKEVFMSKEQIEAGRHERTKIKKAGYIDLNHFWDVVGWSASGMQKFGDPFTVSLGLTLAVAPLEDALKILRYWCQLCEQHCLMYKMWLAKEKAMNES